MRKVKLYAMNLQENGELLWNIQNVLQKISSQINMNDLRNIWNSIQNGKWNFSSVLK